MQASSRRFQLPDSRRSSNQRLTFGQRWFAVVVAVLATITVVTAPVIAGVLVENSLEGETQGFGRGLIVLDFDSGAHLTVSGQADWDAGAYSNATADASTSGNLSLDHRGDVPAVASPTWWDTTWGLRRCITIDNTDGPQIDIPIKASVDTTLLVANGDLLSNGADFRAILSSDGSELPIWVEGPVPDAATSIWFKIANLPTGPTEVCLYHGNPAAPATSDPSILTSGPSVAKYYTMTRHYDSKLLSIVSYTDGNQVSVDGAAPVTINRGQLQNFSVTRHSVVTSTAPIAGASASNATDTIIPETYADNEFVFATNRGQQVIWVRAPFGPVTLEAFVGGAVKTTTLYGVGGAAQATQTITPADGAVGIIAEAGSNRSVYIRSTTGGDFLSAHTSGTNIDAAPGVPWRNEPLYGVRSNYTQVGGGSATASYSVLGSEGSNFSASVGPSALIRYNPNAGDSRGRGPGWKITPTGSILGATQYADSNGSEITNFFPASLLETEYFLPVQANYAAIVCPTVGQTVTMTPPTGTATVLSCTNSGVPGAPGKAYVGLTVIAPATRFSSPSPFYLYMESRSTNDEQNVIGANAFEAGTFSPGMTYGPLQGVFHPTGTWSSPTYDTGGAGVYGLHSLLTSLPPGTSATVQIASGTSAAAASAATPVGPDGTAATSYTTGSDVVSSAHDFDQFIRVVVTLTTSDPLASPVVNSIDLSNGLVELSTSGEAMSTINVAAGPGVDTHLVARIHSTGTLDYEATISYADGTNLPAVDLFTLRTDDPADQVRAVAGSVVQGQGAPFSVAAGQTFSLFLDEDIQAGNVVSIDVTVSAEETDGLFVEHDLRFVLTS